MAIHLTYRIRNTDQDAPKSMAPTTVPLTTTKTITSISASVAAYIQINKNYKAVEALLFATGVDGPTTVKVVKIAQNATNEWSNLLYMPWLATDPTHPITNLSFIDMDVGDSVDGNSAFTVLAPDQESPMGSAELLHPLNGYFQGKQQPGAEAWRGNILVVQREPGTDILVDMTEAYRRYAELCAFRVATSYHKEG
ncbi:hypothetical protein C8R47DRAFT_1148281 [Mycena vitilis]|nr:hypothetical protein C8R47DRAFT_1148281 [Mycena vitilis]